MNGDRSVQNAASGRGVGGQAVAERAVADLVVVLAEDDEVLGRAVVGGRAEARLRKVEYSPSCDERAVERLGELGDRPELRVVAVAVAGEQRAQRVVEVVGPGGVVAEAALRAAGG